MCRGGSFASSSKHPAIGIQPKSHSSQPHLTFSRALLKNLTTFEVVEMAAGVLMSMDKGGGGSNSDVWGRGKAKKRAADESNFTDLERFEKRLRRLTLRMTRPLLNQSFD